MINKYVHRPKTPIWGKEIEYIINKEQFDAIANKRDNKKMNPYIYVIEELNSTGGLLSTVVSLSVEGDFMDNKSRIKAIEKELSFFN